MNNALSSETLSDEFFNKSPQYLSGLSRLFLPLGVARDRRTWPAIHTIDTFRWKEIFRIFCHKNGTSAIDHPQKDSSLQTPGSSVPGYLPPEGPALASHHSWNHDFSRATSSEFLRNDLLQSRPGGYAVDGRAGVGSESVPGHIGLPIARGYSPLEDPALLRRDAALGIKPSLTDIERPEAFRKSEGLLLDESNVLSVDGLPRDCTRREVAHLFRPFVGFKEIRVIHKEPRHVGDKGHVLCFVEFDDAKCAHTALQALRGYKFDDKKADTPVLKIQFAKFPLPRGD
ncbi:nuclear speckle RNA-binding protein A-like [Phalaenopsis equestris]|uniref:nuclear speckle RNA-binding protein A-like n=1 Tax=Phalaenopsis equestris TaxID=78828 RepID=UPI0009E4C396|nr:nuclear speckle RNA-binding protein A-like [Phalaenopsis equestris]